MLSSFFQGQQHAEDAYTQQKEQSKKDAAAGKPGNVTMEAIDNVMRLRQIRQYYKDLEHMVRWELGMPDLWAEIVEERERLNNEREQAKQLADKLVEQARLKREYRLQVIRQNIILFIAVLMAICSIVGFLCAVNQLIQEDMTRRFALYQ